MTHTTTSKSIDCVFYVAYPYYFPHFLPISNYFKQQEKEVLFILSDDQNTPLMEKIANEEGLRYQLGKKCLSQIQARLFFFANENTSFDKVSGHTIFLDHGVGTKFCDYALAAKTFDSVLIEGTYRQSMLENLLPDKQDKIHCVGFSKLDNFVTQPGEKNTELLLSYGLDPNKPTVLYAPTFFPSSIEKMGLSFPQDLSHCNVIIKPHYLSLERKKYSKQQQRFKRWAMADNCYVAGVDEYNLTQFIQLADVMISDESSAIFECVALNKPVIINRFLTLRWSYRLNPKKLLKRLDKGIDFFRRVGYNPKKYNDMLTHVEEALSHPQKHQTLRSEVTAAICGVVDGRVSQRIYELFFK